MGEVERTVSLLANNVLDVLLLGESAVEGDGSRLDGDTTLLLVGTSIRGASLTSLAGENNTGLGEERVGQSGLAVINVRNDGHVAHVSGLVHQGTDLVNREAIRGRMVSIVVVDVCVDV